jgi:hypothetical protein
MGHAIFLQLNASNWLINSSLTNDFLNTRRKYITYEIFIANLHVTLFLCQPTHMHCKSSSLDSPKPALTRDSVCKQITATITHGKAGQGRPRQDHQRQTSTTITPKRQAKTTSETTGRPLGLCRNGSHLANPFRTLPFPSRQSINQ